MTPLRVLVYTETYSVGGCDRMLADLASHVDPEAVDLTFAGNAHPDLDEYLAGRVPGFTGRDEVEVANMRDPLLGKVAHRLGISARARNRGAERPWERPWEAADETTSPPSPSALQRVEVATSTAQRLTQAGRNLLALRALVRRHRPDVLHANNGGYPGAESVRVAPIAARAEGVPSVQFVHNMAFPLASPRAVERAIDTRVDRAVGAWVTAAGRASDALATEHGIPRDRIRTVHYGVPVPPQADVSAAARADLGFPPSEVGVLVVAAFEPRKGHSVLVNALNQIGRECTRPYVALVGVGSEREAVEAQVRALGLDDRIRFLGWRRDVDRLMQASDILVLPSLGMECLPYAILEAMSHGKPVVGTDVAGIPEMVDDGVTGAVVAPGDPAALAAALRRLVEDPQARTDQGAAGRDRIAQQFTIGAMAGNMEKLWREVAARAARD